MRNKRIGKRTMKMQNSPTIISTASIVGPKEGKGPLKDKFDVILPDDLYGEKTWELAESKMIQTALETAVQKVEKQLDDIEFLFGGDLINQIFPASFAARALGIPFCGIYGACSTMALGMCLSSIVVDGGFADYALNGTSSHYCTAERQFRFPLELGNQKPMTAQWTVTGAGSALISSSGEGPKVKYITIGKVVDKVLELDGTVFITADHGNAEVMIDYSNGKPFTAHTTDPVPFVWVSNHTEGKTLKNGKLADIAPTMLNVMGLEAPVEMTGENLIISK